MPNNSSDLPKAGAADKELALWMLERMRLSEQSLGAIRQARSAGGTDVLDTPDYVALHTKRLAPLYKGADEEVFDAPASLVAKIEMLAKRDLLSSPEEFIEKALAAYIAKHTKGNAQGVKNPRVNIRVVPLTAFDPLEDIGQLSVRLFGNDVTFAGNNS